MFDLKHLMAQLTVILISVAVACGGIPPVSRSGRTLPSPLFSQEVLDMIPDVPPDKRISLPVSECVVEGTGAIQKTSAGIYMTQEMAMRVARLKVAYDEIRGLYRIDLVTMNREREIYERYLQDAEDEIDLWRRQAQRSWWEKNRGTMGLVLGILTGAALTIGVTAVVVEVDR